VYSEEASASALERSSDRGSPASSRGDSELDGLAAALGVLPELHKEVLLMRVVDEMSMAEIAAALSIPVGTVKSRLHHALAALRADPRTKRYFLPEEG